MMNSIDSYGPSQATKVIPSALTSFELNCVWRNLESPFDICIFVEKAQSSLAQNGGTLLRPYDNAINVVQAQVQLYR